MGGVVLSSWVICSCWYDFFDTIPKPDFLNVLFNKSYFYINNISLLPVIIAYGLFFIALAYPEDRINGKNQIIAIEPVCVDVYVLLSMNGPNKTIFWIDLLHIKKWNCQYNILLGYLIIVIAFLAAIVAGKLRLFLFRYIKNKHFLERSKNASISNKI